MVCQLVCVCVAVSLAGCGNDALAQTGPKIRKKAPVVHPVFRILQAKVSVPAVQAAFKRLGIKVKHDSGHATFYKRRRFYHRPFNRFTGTLADGGELLIRFNNFRLDWASIAYKGTLARGPHDARLRRYKRHRPKPTLKHQRWARHERWTYSWILKAGTFSVYLNKDRKTMQWSSGLLLHEMK